MAESPTSDFFNVGKYIKEKKAERAHEVNARESLENRALGVQWDERVHEVNARESLENSALGAQEPTIDFKPSRLILGPGVPPVSGIARMTGGFGKREAPTKGASSNHRALDIASALGTPAVSMRSGRVVFAGRKGGYGNQVVVKFYDGVTVSYSHMKDISVKAGDRVVMGQPVGSVGSTGISTGPHLHIEAALPGKDIWTSSQRSDPMKVLPELSRLKLGEKYDFGAAQEPGASESEIELLRLRYQDVLRAVPPVPYKIDEAVGIALDEAYGDYAFTSGLTEPQISDSTSLKERMADPVAEEVYEGFSMVPDETDDGVLTGGLK